MPGEPDHYREILKQLKELCKAVGLPPKRLLTIEETAYYLGISPRTIRNGLFRETKKPFPVKPVKLAGRVLFRRSDLDNLIEGLNQP